MSDQLQEYAKGMLYFANTKHSSNFHSIRNCVLQSIADRLWPITEASTADTPLALMHAIYPFEILLVSNRKLVTGFNSVIAVFWRI